MEDRRDSPLGCTKSEVVKHWDGQRYRYRLRQKV